MNEYLKDFFSSFNYEQKDAEYLLNVYQLIKANQKAFELWQSAVEQYDKNFNCDYDNIIDVADKVAQIVEINEYTTELLIFICLSERLKELYIKNGIDLNYFYDSMLDLRYKLEECKLVYGIKGSFVAGWFVGFFNLTRFGIGRLQFEVINFGASYQKNGYILTPESKVINIHIPRSMKPLSEEECEKSYKLAKEFFKDQLNVPFCAFVCDSWLLFSQNKSFLPKNGNTYRFFCSFDIFSSRIDKTRSELWRLFDTQEKRLELLPANTSLRRAFINHLKSGGKMGVGRGIMFMQDD